MLQYIQQPEPKGQLVKSITFETKDSNRKTMALIFFNGDIPLGILFAAIVFTVFIVFLMISLGVGEREKSFDEKVNSLLLSGHDEPQSTIENENKK